MVKQKSEKKEKLCIRTTWGRAISTFKTSIELSI